MKDIEIGRYNVRKWQQRNESRKFEESRDATREVTPLIAVFLDLYLLYSRKDIISHELLTKVTIQFNAEESGSKNVISKKQKKKKFKCKNRAAEKKSESFRLFEWGKHDRLAPV